MDNDFDGEIDEPGAIGCQTYVFDGDDDNYGNPAMSGCFCAPFGNYTSQGIGGDCDDTNPDVHMNALEICDDGLDNDCDNYADCSDSNCVSDASCQQELTCVAAESLYCGVPNNGNTTDTGSADIINAYNCTNWDETGREYVYRFNPGDVNRNVSVAISNAVADLDILILEDECSPDSCIGFDGNTANFTAEAEKTYYFSVDGNSGAEGSYTINVNCQ